MPRRAAAALLALVAAGGLSACGHKQHQTLKAETEGIYVDVGSLKYQVQVSRQLNPADPEDSQFLTGVTQKLGAQDVWFGVFVRVENQSNAVQSPASAYEIDDTQGNVFTPELIGPGANDYAYRPVRIPGKGTLPTVDETAAQNLINGKLLLFKVPRLSLDNRPLELKIHNPANDTSVATVNLDV